jgi:hypothetical protein
MSEPAPPKALLIDLDNCPGQLDRLPHVLDGYVRVIVCHGVAAPKVALSLVPLLAAALHARRLEIVGMKRGGKNAADFGLAFCAGRLVAELPPETAFEILSADKDLDHVIDLLRRAGRAATRLDGTAATASAPPPDAPNEALDEALETYQAAFLKPGWSRPTSRKALLASLGSHFKGRKEVDPKQLLALMLKRRLIAIGPRDKVVYLAYEDAADDDAPPGIFDDSIPF